MNILLTGRQLACRGTQKTDGRLTIYICRLERSVLKIITGYMWRVVQRKGWKLAVNSSHMNNRTEPHIWTLVYNLGSIIVFLGDFHFLRFLLFVICKEVKVIFVVLFKACVGSEGYWVHRIHMCTLTHSVLIQLTSVQTDWSCVSETQFNIFPINAGVNIAGVFKFSNRKSHVHSTCHLL
jgi:hypothetical protein